MGTSASGLPVVDLVFHSSKDLVVAMAMWSIPSGPCPCETWGTLYNSFISIYLHQIIWLMEDRHNSDKWS